MIDNEKIKLLLRSNFIVLLIIVIFSILLTFYIKKYENYSSLRLNISDINTNSLPILSSQPTFFFEDELLDLQLNIKNWEKELVNIANITSKLNLNKFSPDEQFLLKFISNPEWWRKSVSPVYTLKKFDSKEFLKSHNKVEYLDIKLNKFANFGEDYNQKILAKLIRLTIVLWYLDKLENYLDLKFSYLSSNSIGFLRINELNLQNISISLKKINDLGNNIIINSGDKNDLYALYSFYLSQRLIINDFSYIEKIWGTNFKISNVINSKTNYPGNSIILNSLQLRITYLYNSLLKSNNNFYIIKMTNDKVVYIFFVVFSLFFCIILLLHFFLKLFTAKRFFIFRL